MKHKTKYVLLLIIPAFITIGPLYGADKCCVLQALVCTDGFAPLCTPRISGFGDVPATSGDRFEKGTGNCGWRPGPMGVPKACGPPPLHLMCI